MKLGAWKRNETVPRLDDAFGGVRLGHIAALGRDLFLYFIDGISRTREVTCITPLHHRQIVQMITRDENLRRQNIETLRDRLETRTLVIELVAEPEIDRVTNCN